MLLLRLRMRITSRSAASFTRADLVARMFDGVARVDCSGTFAAERLMTRARLVINTRPVTPTSRPRCCSNPRQTASSTIASPSWLLTCSFRNRTRSTVTNSN